MTLAIVKGWGARGFFQLGALIALEEMKISPDIIFATSVVHSMRSC